MTKNANALINRLLFEREGVAHHMSETLSKLEDIAEAIRNYRDAPEATQDAQTVSDTIEFARSEVKSICDELDALEEKHRERLAELDKNIRVQKQATELLIGMKQRAAAEEEAQIRAKQVGGPNVGLEFARSTRIALAAQLAQQREGDPNEARERAELGVLSLEIYNSLGLTLEKAQNRPVAELWDTIGVLAGKVTPSSIS